MQRFKSKVGPGFQPAAGLLLVLLLAVGAVAQTISEKPTADVRRVGQRLQCQCGCKDSVSTCNMLECSFSKPAKERIARMQAAGYSDGQIVDAFIRDYGQKIYFALPSAFGWVVPYVGLGLGLLVIWAFVKKYRKPKAMTELGPMEIDDPALDKYKDQIEEDLKKIE
ncbi:MAG TPA: cytochrome c-type biogenesis protein CcmH [Bryobacteraceae bacterium]|jgi:cytochrome c-type biogenesis protein CcmH|nr:cytochrome c-type biogenesis protein CcmH [Bryobacteraceae bacterium]